VIRLRLRAANIRPIDRSIWSLATSYLRRIWTNATSLYRPTRDVNTVSRDEGRVQLASD